MGTEIVRPDWGPDGEHRNLVQTSSSAVGVFENSPTELAPTAELAATSIEAAVSTPEHLNASVAGLPESLKAKMRETLAISPMRRGAEAAEIAFLSRLTPEEREAFSTWVDGLTDEERGAIASWFNGEYRR